MIRTERLHIEPLDSKYLKDYFDGFNKEITKYQWPDPFPDIDSARNVLQGFLDEMKQGESLYFSILLNNNQFLGSVEVHGLTEDCPELGIWIAEGKQNKGYAGEALCAVLDYVRSKYDRQAFFYEADIRNEASVKLLHKMERDYEIIEQGFEELTTDSGKDLKLQRYILKAR